MSVKILGLQGICDNSIYLYKRYSLPPTRDHKHIKNFISKKLVVLVKILNISATDERFIIF